MDLPQVYIEGNTNARKNAMKGKVKGRKLTLDPAGDSFPHLDANMSVGTYNFPRVDEGNEPNTLTCCWSGDSPLSAILEGGRTILEGCGRAPCGGASNGMAEPLPPGGECSR